MTAILAEMIEVKDLFKSYGKEKIPALNGLSFSVNRGELFGVIGPDGAGKSSLFRILVSLILPDSGTITINNYDVVRDFRHIRKIMGYMPERFALYGDLSVEENLKFHAMLFNANLETNYHLIKDIYSQIEPFRKRRADALSGGMKQKLSLCCALVHNPQILILDEPTTGVDPVSRMEFWEILGRLSRQGITILVSTAYMDEASRCGRIALLQEGDIIALGAPNAIIENYSEILWSVRGTNMYGMLKALRRHPFVKSCFAFGDTLHITVHQGINPYEIKSFLNKEGFSDSAISEITPSIEDCFMLGNKEVKNRIGNRD